MVVKLSNSQADMCTSDADRRHGSAAGSVSSRPDDEFSNRSAQIIDGIRRDECSAVEEMYCLLGTGVRRYLNRHLETREAEAKVFDVLLVVLRAIRDGSLVEPERLLSFVRGVAHCMATAGERREPKAVMGRYRISLLKQVLNELSERDRDILRRFYLWNQTQQQICDEIDVTETYFQLLKSRAKDRFDELRLRNRCSTGGDGLVGILRENTIGLIVSARLKHRK
jgi:RNA polymerase sigma-70 factor, ECF subfamily